MPVQPGDALGCGRAKTPEDDLPPLDKTPLEGRIAKLARESYEAMARGEDAHAPLAPAFLRYHRLAAAIERPETRREAGDSLYALWRVDPENFLWIDLASGNNHLLQRTAQRDSLYSLPALADSTGPVGRFLYARRFFRRPGAPA